MPKKGINSPKGIYLLGYDPIGKQFKVLCLSMNNSPYSSPNRLILTLECGKRLWRRLEPEFNFMENSGGVVGDDICINGVLYFEGRLEGYFVIVCFDVRYEEFKVIEAKCFNRKTPTLINYKGKLGGINWESGDSGAIELRMWVLHDVNKKEWSKYVYPFPENDVIKVHEFTVAGMTTRGEFDLSMLDTFKRFYILYFNAEKNTLRSVEI